MNSPAFTLGEELQTHIVNYYLHKPLWDSFNIPNIDLNFTNWINLKYLNELGEGFNPQIESVPNDAGGLYLFYVKCDILSGITEFPFYIGRAQFTTSQNLRKRVKEYFQLFSRNDERPKITRMFKYWSNDLHLAYFVLEENDDIIDLEKQLINSLLLPMNDEIPNKDIKAAIKAFS